MSHERKIAEVYAGVVSAARRVLNYPPGDPASREVLRHAMARFDAAFRAYDESKGWRAPVGASRASRGGR